MQEKQLQETKILHHLNKQTQRRKSVWRKQNWRTVSILDDDFKVRAAQFIEILSNGNMGECNIRFIAAWFDEG